MKLKLVTICVLTLFALTLPAAALCPCLANCLDEYLECTSGGEGVIKPSRDQCDLLLEACEDSCELDPTCNPAPSCASPPGSMVAWWTFDYTTGTGTSPDAIGFNVAWHHNGPDDVPGKVQGALYFDGFNDYLQVDDQNVYSSGPDDLDFGTGDFSIDLWIQTTQDTGVPVILDKRSGVSGTFTGYSLWLWQGLLGLQIADGSSGSYTNYTSNVYVADGPWHMVAVTVDRNSTSGIRWYNNGLEVGPRQNPTGRSGSITNSADLFIGRRLTGDGHFNGTFDELELFDRVLTAQEIAAIFNANWAGKCLCRTC